MSFIKGNKLKQNRIKMSSPVNDSRANRKHLNQFTNVQIRYDSDLPFNYCIHY